MRKTFNCLALLCDVRKRLADKTAGLSVAERDERRAAWLAHSQDRLARVWRGETQSGAVLRADDEFFDVKFPPEDYDPVAMKYDIQAHLEDLYEGMSVEERQQHWRDHLEGSDDPLARLWRGCYQEESPDNMIARDDHEPYEG